MQNVAEDKLAPRRSSKSEAGLFPSLMVTRSAGEQGYSDVRYRCAQAQTAWPIRAGACGGRSHCVPLP